MDRYRIKPHHKVDLSDYDPADKSALDDDKESGKERLGALNREIEALQELFYADGRFGMLIVLQGMDTSGKDGVIRQVFEGVNPQGVRVASFKAPSAAEMAHDYLWRIHKRAPAQGEMVIFNRSHYEDVLIVRVHGLVPEARWSRRYEQINAFEKMLSEESTVILKFFLHISPEEQKQRLEARLEDPSKHWKFNTDDLKERKYWPDYIKAYEDVLSKTSTKWAPWYIVPSDRKWYRNVVIGSVIADTLKSLDLRYPKPKFDPAGIKVE